MELTLYKDKVTKALKTKDAGLRDMVLAGLAENRAQFLSEAADILTESPGQVRLALLSAMIEDGGKDLVPLFSTFAASEPNTLFAKSLVMLMAHFDHFEALTALRDMQSGLKPEVKAAAGRAIAKLNSKFREQFYMDEFRAGKDNPKRIKHAVETMLANPDPIYVPFLNEIIGEPDTIYREPGVTVLHGLADATSVEPLKALMQTLVSEGVRNDTLCRFLLTETTNSLIEFLTLLGRQGGWEPGLAEELSKEVLAKKVSTTLEWYKHSFGPFPHLLEEGLMPFVREQLLRGRPDATKKARLATAYAANRDWRDGMLRTICATLGRLGMEHKIEGLEQAFEATFPADLPRRAAFHVALLSGYRTPEALTRLGAYLTNTTDTDLQLEVINALIACEVRKQPPGLSAIALNATVPELRARAMVLMAQCRAPEHQIRELLHADHADVRTAARRMIAAHGLEEGYGLLIGQLPHAEDADELVPLLEALAAFPRGQTGTAAAPYFLPRQDIKVRRAALKTLVAAGGPTRMALLFSCLEDMNEEEAVQAIAMVLAQLEPLKTDELPPDVLAQAAPWGALLKHKSGRIRDGALAVLHRADWHKKRDPQWPETLENVLADASIVRTDGEKARVQNLLQWAAGEISSGDINSRFRAELLLLMETIESASQYDKNCALRKLNIIYREDLVEPQDKSRLIYQMNTFFQQAEGDPSGLKLAVAIAAKVGDPQLLESVEKLEHHEDAELARFARKAHDIALRNVGQVREVRSIFVLDQVAMMAGTLSKALARTGYDVASATSAREALAMLVKRPYDLLLLGYRLGDVTGVQFYKEAKHRHVAPERLIFLTAGRNSDEEREMTAAGADAILLKPFPMDQLYQKIKDLSFSSEQIHLSS